MRTISIFLAGFVPPLAGFVIHPVLGVVIVGIDIFIIIFI